NSGNLISVPIIKSNSGKLVKIKNFIKNFYLIQFALDLRQRIIIKNNGYDVYSKNYSFDYQKAWQITEKVLLKTKQDVENSESKYLIVSSANNEQVNSDNYPISWNKSDLEKPDKLM